jgi:membrane-associated phospholipid phosphatase
MSTGGAEPSDRAIRWSTAGFVLLLTLAVLWPGPVLWINDATWQLDLPIHERSFLGRQAPSWDVVFWCMAGLFLLAIAHGRLGNLAISARAFRADWPRIRRNIRRRWGLLGKVPLLFLAVTAGLVAVVWLHLDAWLISQVAILQNDLTVILARYLNRLGGGMSPVIVVLWFAIAGLLFLRPRWTELALCMAFASVSSGILVQLLKYVVGRSRPELWLGPFDHTLPSATSFPSGHTVGAFAIGSVLYFGARQQSIRWTAMLLATGVGLARIFAFRHWPSDVIASALLGTAVGWFFVLAVREERSEGQVASNEENG